MLLLSQVGSARGVPFGSLAANAAKPLCLPCRSVPHNPSARAPPCAAVPLDRVHNMLKMFASDPPYDKSLEQLGAYMARLVADEKLSLEGGTYRKR